MAHAENHFRMSQSHLRYTKDWPQYGIKAGERERSFCIFQIHEPAHHATAVQHGYEDYKTDIEDCIAMARVIYEQRGNSFTPWTVYVKGMHLAHM